MIENIYSEELLELVKKYDNKRVDIRIISSKYPKLYQLLLQETDFLPEDSVVRRRFYHIINNTKIIPICAHKECNKLINYNKYVKRYPKYCNSKCSSNTKEVQEKVKQTTMKNHGVEYVFQSLEIKEKIKQTMLKNHGVEHALQSPVIKEKIKQTMLKNHGVEHALQSPVIKEKIKQTNLERYGYEYSTQSSEIQEKMKQTMLKNHGVEYSMQSPGVQEKAKQTMLKNHGVEHALQSSEIQEKIKQTNLERYGYEYSTQSSEIQEKMKQTNLERYEVEYTLQFDKIKEKIKQTNLDRYGVEYPFQAQEIREKSKQTMLELYGVEHALEAEEFQKKYKQTMLDLYGVEYPFQLEKFQEKAKQTNLDRYGFKYASQSEEIKEKMKQTSFKRYTVEYFTQKHISHEALENLNNKNWMYDQHIVQQKSLIQISRELNITDATVGKYLHDHGMETQCYFSSTGEDEVNDYVVSLGFKTIRNSRKIISPYELDVYIPELNLAIEYNGLLWHSEQFGKDRHYHKRKYDFCKKLGIQLITIFEDEWQQHKKQVKAKLKVLLNVDDREIIYARKTGIINVSKQTKRLFHNENHIQGDGKFSVNIGLLFDNKLVACMSFINRADDNYELSRYSTSARVVGGFSKLLNYFKNTFNPKTIISFADLRWSIGNLYIKTGWKIDKIINPDYSYSPDGKNRYHKFNYRRKNLENLLENFDPLLSEKINCDKDGMLRIWDCGKIRFIINN